MTGFHFFVETNGGEWHRTENTGEPGSTEAARCSCRIAVDDARVLKVRGHDDDSWQWVPKSQLGACFPKEMRDENGAMVAELHPQDSGLDAALEAEVARVVSDAAHPTRVAYERARAAHPDGGDAAKAAFHRFLREEKIKRDAGTDRRAPKAPRVDEKTGVPMCSQLECPKYARYQGRCTETDDEDPTVCKPAVMDMALELDARKDAADPAFDEIIALCGLAKTWEYPGQVVRDVADSLKKRDDEIAALQAGMKRLEGIIALDLQVHEAQKQKIAALRTCVVYARDRRGNSFDFDEWKHMVDKALEGTLPAHALEDAQAKEAQAWAAVTAIRKDRDALKAALKHVVAHTKHGPRGSGAPGPCDAGCAKCHAEAALKAAPGSVDLLARVEEERTKDLHVMSAQGRAIEELRAQNTKLDTALRSLVRRTCHTPLLNGYSIAVDYQQYEEEQRKHPELPGAGLRKEIATVDELCRAVMHRVELLDAANEYLRGQLHTALIVRDDARAASNRAIEEKRAIEAAGAELTALVAKLMPEKQKEASLAERAWLPFTDRDVANAAPAVKESPGQCPWIMPDGDPDEGYWHCKLPENHTEKHVTEFGRGLDARWYLPCEGMAHTFVGDCCRDCGYPVVKPEPELIDVVMANRYNLNPPLQVACPRCGVPAGELCDEKSSETWSTGMTHVARANMIGRDLMPKPWARPHASAAEIRDAIIAEVGMMADARTPAMQAAYDAALAREGKVDSMTGPVSPPPAGVVVRIPGHELFIEQPQATQACECSLKYLEIAPGVHAKYCPLAGLPLSDGRSRWRCEPCDLTFRSPADAPTEPIASCQQCGKPTTEVARA